MSPMPQPPYSPDLTTSDWYTTSNWYTTSGFFFYLPDGKVLEVKQKHGRSTKSKSMSSKTVLSRGRKHLDRCIASNGEYQYFESEGSLNI